MRKSTDTKAGFKTTGLIAYVVAVVAAACHFVAMVVWIVPA